MSAEKEATGAVHLTTVKPFGQGSEKHINEADFHSRPFKKFQHEAVQILMQKILEKNLVGKKYDPQFCSSLTKELSENILREMKNLEYPRYKFVCLVTIGQKKDQGIHMVSRFLWDAETDSFATAAYENADLYSIATIYATYFE